MGSASRWETSRPKTWPIRHEGILRAAFGDLVHQVEIDPIGDRAEVAHDGPRDAFEQLVGFGLGEEGIVGAVAGQHGMQTLGAEFALQFGAGDHQDVALAHQVALFADVEGAHVLEGLPIVHAVVEHVGVVARAQFERQAPPEGKLHHDGVPGDGPIAIEAVECGGHLLHVVGPEFAEVDIGLAAAEVNLPDVFAQGDHRVRVARRRREKARGADPENAVALASQFHGDLLRTLEAEIEIDDAENHHVVLVGRRRGIGTERQDGMVSRIGNGRGAAERVRDVAGEIGEGQLILCNRAHAAERNPQRPAQEGGLGAMQQRVGLAEKEHDLPGSLRAVSLQLLPEERLVTVERGHYAGTLLFLFAELRVLLLGEAFGVAAAVGFKLQAVAQAGRRGFQAGDSGGHLFRRAAETFERGLQGGLFLFDQLAAPGGLDEFAVNGAILLLHGLAAQLIETLQARTGFGGRVGQQVERDAHVLAGRLAQGGDAGRHAARSVQRRDQPMGKRRRFQVLHVDFFEPQELDDAIHFGVVAEGHGRDAGGGSEDQGVQAHAQHHIAIAQTAVDVFRGGGPGGYGGAILAAHLSQDAGRGGAVVFAFAGEILKRHQHYRAIGLLHEQVERAGQFTFPEIGMDAQVPMTCRHRQHGFAQRELADGLRQAAGSAGFEGEGRVGSDAHFGGRHPDLFQHGLGTAHRGR